MEQESVLLTQAFELSRGGGDRRGVDALFAQVQAMQVERKQLEETDRAGAGTQRLHEAAEVRKLGVYDYRRVVGGDPVRVHVTQGPLGLRRPCCPASATRCGSNAQGDFDVRLGPTMARQRQSGEAVAQNRAHAGTPAQAQALAAGWLSLPLFAKP